MNIGILGGGLSGLSIALNLKHNFEILEKEENCGGLCQSHTENGFTYDICGGHIIFSKDKEILDFMLNILGKNKLENKRNTKIYYKSYYVNYPFENGLSDLPKSEALECLYTFIETLLNSNNHNPQNFKQWIYSTYGAGIAEKYMIPFNEKIWNFDTEKMSIEWVERIPKPPHEDIIKSFLGNVEGYKHQAIFYYPIEGGIESFIKALESRIRNNITKNFEVKKISRKADKWLVSDGKKEKEFDRIVSTIPLHDLINSLSDVPTNVKIAVNNLLFNSHITVCLGLNKKISDYHWIYFPDKDIVFYKKFNLSNCSNKVAPDGKFCTMLQLTCRYDDETWNKNNDELVSEIIGTLCKKNIIKSEYVCYSSVSRHKYAYIVYELEYKKNLKIVHDYLRSLDIYLCGRFSEFKYMNMDDCIKSAFDCAKKLNNKCINAEKISH